MNQEPNTQEPNTQTPNTQEPNTQEPQSKTFTEEEVMALIQKESDKRVSQALQTQQKKFEKQLSLSQLDGDARKQAEKDNRIAELEEKLATYEVEKNKSELKSVLNSRGLSTEFADILIISSDLQESQSNIDKLDKLFKAAVKAEVEKRISTTTQPKGNIMNTEKLDKNIAKTMGLAEMTELLNTNPEKYKELFG